MISAQRTLRGAAVVATLLVLATLLSACGSPGDGGWLATGSDWAFFLQINGNSGTADYAYTIGQNLNTDHADITVNNDSTLSFDVVHYGGGSGGCPEGCPYTVNANTLVLTIPGAAPLTFQSGTISQFEDARSNIQATIADQANAQATAQAQAQAQAQAFKAQEQAKCEAIKGASWDPNGRYGDFFMDACHIEYYYTQYGIFFDVHGNVAPNACDDRATQTSLEDAASYEASGQTDYFDYYVQTCSVETAEQAKANCLNGTYFGILDLRGEWHADTDICQSY